MTGLAAVVIGRNEGPRLARALQSVLGECDPIVYVDSASTDGSQDAARALGVDVLALDMSIPFTFGRARNRGAERVLELAPRSRFIQFVDADSEIVASWLVTGATLLAGTASAAAAHGRVRERYARDGVFDRLFALEFDPRTEDENVFGGMVMLRVSALQQVGWYYEHLQTFEDHDLSARLRGDGWAIVRLDADMVIHEGGMTRWAEWWTRERRAGLGRAQLLARHGWGSGREWRRPVVSICFWGALLPLATIAVLFTSGVWLLAALLAYAALLYRIFRRMRRRGMAMADAALYAAGRVIGKFPQFHGVLSSRQRRGISG
jgi:glycosyltransferase involved in cell wall biosynthesis